MISSAPFTISKQRELVVHPHREARPITDDMRAMCDDIDRVEPLPVLIPRTWLTGVRLQIVEQLDKSFLNAIYGGSHLVPRGSFMIPLQR